MQMNIDFTMRFLDNMGGEGMSISTTLGLLIVGIGTLFLVRKCLGDEI